MRPAENKAHTIIIGGGASGLAAACVLSKAGLPFTVLEKENKPARKLLATGNGRCNLMNTGAPVFFGDAAFAGAVLAACPAAEVGRFFEGIGLSWFEEEQGRVYPNARQAGTVADCLLAAINAGGTGSVLTGQSVRDIKKTGNGFQVSTEAGQVYTAQRLIACPGSPAAPKLGGGDSLMAPLIRLGHRLLPFFPALCAIETATAPIKGLAGLRFPAALTLLVDGQPLCAAAGEALITETGISGLCAMQLARDAHQALARGQAVTLVVDCAPMLGLDEIRYRRLDAADAGFEQSRQAILALLTKRRERLGQGLVYTGLLPRQMAQKLAGVSIREAARWLGGLALAVHGVRGFDQAQVAAGGIDCRDIDPDTMASRLAPGLHLCGEALNVDGDTGGFNLLFAWATGILAGRAVMNDLV